MRWDKLARFIVSVSGAAALGFAVGIVTSLVHPRWHASDVQRVVSFTTGAAAALALVVQVGAWLPPRWKSPLDAMAGAALGYVWWEMFAPQVPVVVCVGAGALLVALLCWRWRRSAARWAATHLPAYPDPADE